MSESTSRALRGGARAITGVLIIGVAATTAVLVGAADLPEVVRGPVSVPAETRQVGDRNFVCSGAFAELGANPSRPGDAVPEGATSLLVAGKSESRTELRVETEGGTAPEVVRAPAGEPFAAAQTQRVRTSNLEGLTALSCAQPVNQQWLVGGTTTVGATATINLGNPGEKPATVELTVFDEDGQVDAAQTSGVLVPAGSERIVSLNGYAPDRERLAVRVTSTGATVTASMEVGQVDGLQSFSVDTVTRQLEPAQRLVVPGVASLAEDEHGPGDVGHAHGSPIAVRALSANGAPGTVTARAMMGDGTSLELGTFELSGTAVGELTVNEWPEKANAVVLDADVPIVGGVMGAALGERIADGAWFSPAPELPADAEVAAAVAPGGRLILANPGDSEARVTVSGSGEATQRYRVPAGAAVAVQAGADSRILSDAPIHAGVSMVAGGALAGYPVLAEIDRSGSLTVFPR